MRVTAVATAICVSLVSLSVAQEVRAAIRKQTHIPAQPLEPALQALARVCDLQVVYRTEIVGQRLSEGVSGDVTADEALQKILSGTGLTYMYLDEKTVTIVPPSAPATDSPRGDSAPIELQEIVVTGSHIRGAESSSPVVKRTQEQMLDAGQNSLREVLRTIPQNFSGGQNPGTGFGLGSTAAGSGNLTGASTLNLRGVGNQATLTLLNGHRLAYASSSNSVDISSIPFGAVERIEIVADGSSALYGADAVVGVANIILKRDYEGVDASARFGVSTEGGNEQQQYGLTSGTTWDGGGILVAAEYQNTEAIEASQRSYAKYRAPGLGLMPELENQSVLVSGHQQLASNLSFEFDGFYAERTSYYTYANDLRGSYLLNGGNQDSQAESFVLAPSLKLELGGDWRTSLSTMVGHDYADFYQEAYLNNAIISAATIGFNNKTASVEINADGPLFALPAGMVRAAVGGGYREQAMRQTNTFAKAKEQETYFAFAELNLPLFQTLSASAAVRYEDYPDIGDVTTPKLGLIYSPTPDFDLKASWGRSFRAPSIYQTYVQANIVVRPASIYGGTGYPANASALYMLVGGRELKPERAKTWSATLDLHPRAISNLQVELSYFNIDYTDRILAPITYSARSLSDPIYRDLVNLSPSDADKTAAIAAAVASGGTFFNQLGRPYDPADVVAIIDNRTANVAEQNIRGVDATVAYSWDLQTRGSLTFTGYASYMDSKQKLSSLQPYVDLSGSVFNPPHLRGNVGVVWGLDALTLSSFVNYVGGVQDVQITPSRDVSSMTTLDLTARYQVPDGPSLFRNIELMLSMQNVFDAQPDSIYTSSSIFHPYDSTNYSPVGRFVRFGISRHW
jgi:outer membrane receptor protein involved in Fe transport